MKKMLVQPGERDVLVKTGTAISSILMTEQIDLPMACGGNGLCATCHVFVGRGAENLSPKTDKEKRTLGRISSVSDNSRLACQCHVLGDCSVSLPEGEYIEDMNVAENMIGRRATANILSPTDGRVIIKKGQIISKFVLKTLEKENISAFSKLSGSQEIKKIL